MEGSIIDIMLFAPIAVILGVLLFWFVQLLFIQGQKYLLEKIRKKHEPFCRFTNFLGILFQTICHALGFTVTKSGISEVYISVNYGKVAPKKEKKGIFEWISNVFLFIGPFFIPAVLLLICLFFLIKNGFNTIPPTNLLDYTFGGQLTIFFTNLYNFTASFFNFLSNLDLFNPVHVGFLFLLLFLGLGIRPSYLGEKKIDKIDMTYELKNIWELITYKRTYLVLFILFCYSLFYISLLLNQIFYTKLFLIFGWLSIISIVALFISQLIILFILAVDQIKGRKKIIPYVTIPLSYILSRILFFYLNIDKSMSLITMMVFTIIVIYLILKPKGDRFKTKKKIKRSKDKSKGEEKDD